MTWWAFDIECEGWDILVHACALSETGEIVHMRTKDDVRAWYTGLDPSDVVWSHNGGGYDFLLIIEACGGEEWSARMAGGAIVSMRAKKGAECRDSMRLFPGSLAKWTGQKEELGLACKCGKECGGYCAISLRMGRADRARMVDYCVQDCRALLSTIKADIARLADEGLEIIGARGLPRLTFGAVAWATAAKMAGIDPNVVETEWGDYDAGILAYYGGHNEVGRVVADAGHRFDVHAMYPWALTHPVPVGRRASIIGDSASRAYDRDVPGSYWASLVLPETDLPLLPHRYSEPKNDGRLVQDRLVWATGRIDGCYTRYELAAAERRGARILRIESADVWEGFEPVYEPYVRHVYAMRDRARASGDSRWAGILKWYANALSGKLAQNPEAALVRVIGEDDDDPAEWDWLGGRVWTKSYRRLAPNCRPIQAAYLTSYSRVKLMERLFRHPGRWLYCDTDSTYLLDYDATDVHESELGSWGYEGSLTDWNALAPKLYRFRDEKGRPKVRARGVPLTRARETMSPERLAEVGEENWRVIDALAAGETISRAAGVDRLKSSGGKFRARIVKRTHKDANETMTMNDGTERPMRCGTRFVLPDGTTRPLHRTNDGRYV